VAQLLLTAVAGGHDPASLVSTRTAVSALILTAALAAINPGLLRIGAGDLGRLALLGIAMAVSNYTYYFALQRVPVATAALLIYTAPLLVLAAGVLFYGERLRRDDVVAAVVTLLGAALVVRAYEPAALRVSAVGVAASVVTAVAFAFYSVWGKRVAPGLSPWTIMTYSFATTALFWLPVAPPWAIPLSPHPPAVWGGLGIVVAFGTLLPFALYLAGLRHISAAHASVTSTLEPGVAAAAAYLVLGERLEPLQLAGGGLSLAGIAILHVRQA
jgi:drug/metabolite transporter (DMT)-like permease